MEINAVVHPGRLSLAASGIVFSGVMLGAALAAFANPMPRPAEPAPWEGKLHPQIVAGEPMGYYQSLPEEVYPTNVAGGYAPAIASTELRWTDTPVPLLHEYRASELAVRDDAEDAASWAAVEDQDVTPPHYREIEQAAASETASAGGDSTEVVADDVQPADGGPKIIHVADVAPQAAAG